MARSAPGNRRPIESLEFSLKQNDDEENEQKEKPFVSGTASSEESEGANNYNLIFFKHSC